MGTNEDPIIVNQPERDNEAGVTEPLEGRVSGLLPGYIPSSRMSFTYTVGPHSWNTSETGKTTSRKEKFRGFGWRGRRAARVWDHTVQLNQSVGHVTVTVAGEGPFTFMLSRAQSQDGAPSPTIE